VAGTETPGRGWLDYVQGPWAELARRGLPAGGADIRIRSDVPSGAGLASSAALLVAVLRAARAAWQIDLDDVALALAAQRAEREFVGAPVGIMDQMVASLGRPGEALKIDTRTLATETVALPPDADLVVIDSGVTHGHAGGEYRIRRAECERAATLLGVGMLCELTPADLPRLAALDPPLDRRARHAVTDSARVVETVAALKAGDLARVGSLFAASHLSMRDDFEISTPEVDALVEAAAADRDVFGARLTGGGFGGSIVALARAGRGAAAAERIARAYHSRTGRQATPLVPVEQGFSPARSAGQA
jgi:galactokinase